MSTKVSKFVNQPDVKSEPIKLKPIKVDRVFQHDYEIVQCDVYPNEWDHAVLITKRQNNSRYDVFMLYSDHMVQPDGTIVSGVVCFGEWNDGVV